MENKLAIAIVALMVAALAAPAVMAGDPTYTASVKSGHSTTIAVTDATFGDIIQGTDKTITGSLNLTNVGDWNASVNAKCSNQSLNGSADQFGLIGATDDALAAVYIGGDKLELGATGNLVALTNTSVDKEIDDGTSANKVPAGGSVIYDAKLTVPGSQTADSYTGLVTITFSNAPVT